MRNFFFGSNKKSEEVKQEEPSLKTYKDDADTAKFKVLIINDEVSTISDSLGITEERREVLEKLCHSAYEDYETFTETMVIVSNEVKHANEFAYAFSVLGHLHSKNAIMGNLAGKATEDLKELLKRLRGGKDGE